MTTDFRDVRPAVDSSRLHHDESGVQGNRIRGSRPTLLDDTGVESLESPYALPSARAETGALLERQLLISGGLDDRRLPPTIGDRRTPRIVVLFGLFVLAVLGAGSALYVQYESTQEEWRTELDARNEEIAATGADNERLVRERRETELRLEKTADELSKGATENQRILRKAHRTEGALELARTELLSLRSEIGGLKERYAKLEAERLAELGAFFRKSILLPLERLRSMVKPLDVTATVGPVPNAATTELESPQVSTERTSPSTQEELRVQSAKTSIREPSGQE